MLLRVKMRSSVAPLLLLLLLSSPCAVNAQDGVSQFSEGSEAYGSALGAGGSDVQAGLEVEARVDLLDVNGQPAQNLASLAEDGAHLDVQGPEDFSVPFEALQGGLEATFKYSIAGSYRLRLVIAGQQLGQVYVVRVVPGPPVLDIDFVRVMQVTHGNAGNRIEFQVQFWDSEENILLAEDIVSRVDFTGTKVAGEFVSPRGGVREASVSYGRQLTITTELFNPMFVGSFSPLMAGEWRVHLVVNGVQLHKAAWPPMRVSPGLMDPEGCTAEGLGLSFMKRAGHNYQLAIVPGDRMGNEVTPQRPEMAYAFSASIHYMEDGPGAEDVGDEVQQSQLFHERDNAFYLRFQPTRSGTLLVDARILGVEIPSSPFKIGVLPEVASPQTSRLVQECDGSGKAAAGITARALIDARDKYGNAAWYSHDPFSVELTSMASGTIVEPSWVTLAEKSGDGKYLISYTVPTPGSYSLAARLLDVEIVGSPMALQVVEALAEAEMVAANSMIDLLGVNTTGRLVAGQQWEGSLYMRDGACLPALPPGSGAELLLRLTSTEQQEAVGGEGSALTIELPLQLGHISGSSVSLVSAVPTLAGEFEATVVMKTPSSTEEESLGAFLGQEWPLLVTVSAAAATIVSVNSAGSAVLTATGGHIVPAGTLLPLNLTVMDRFGNVVSDESASELLSKSSLVALGGDPGCGQTQGHINSTNSAEILLTCAGSPVRVVTALPGSGEGLAGGLNVSVAPGGAAQGRAAADGNTTRGLVGRNASIRLRLRDEFGNQAEPPGGGSLSCAVALEAPNVSEAAEGGNSSCVVTDRGSVEVTFNLRRLGRYTVSVGLSIVDPAAAYGNRRLLQSTSTEPSESQWVDSYDFSVEVVDKLPEEKMEEPAVGLPGASVADASADVPEAPTDDSTGAEAGLISGLSPSASIWVLVAGGAGALLLCLSVLAWFFWWQPRATKVASSADGLAAADGNGPTEQGTPAESQRWSGLVSNEHIKGMLPPIRGMYSSPAKVAESHAGLALPDIRSPVQAVRMSQEPSGAPRDLWGSGSLLSDAADFIREVSSRRIIATRLEEHPMEIVTAPVPGWGASGNY